MKRAKPRTDRSKPNSMHRGIPSEVLVPQRKDWNEDLLYMQGVETKIESEKSEGLNGEEREEEKCRELQLS